MNSPAPAIESTGVPSLLEQARVRVGAASCRAYRDAVPLAGLAALLAIFFDEVLFTNRAVLPYDVQYWHYPQQSFLVDQLARGYFPLWTPLVYGGMPFAADMQSASFYPVNLFAMFAIAHVKGYLPYRALELIEIGHYLIAGIGTYALARHFRLRPLASFCAAAPYMMGPYLASEAQHLGLIESAAWVPLVALFTHRAMTRGAIGDGVLAAITWSFGFLAGFFAAAVPVALGLAIYFGQAIARRTFLREHTSYPAPVLISSIVGILGAGLTAVQILPTMELAALTIASDRGIGLSPTPLAYVITMLLPNFFHPASIQTYWAGVDASQSNFYFGILPALLLPLAFHRTFRPLALVLAASATAAILVILGARTPITSLLSIILPSAVVQGVYVYTFRVIVDLSVALTIGLAVEALISGGLEGKDRLARMTDVTASAIGLFLVLATGFAYALALAHDVGQSAALTPQRRDTLDAIVSDAFLAAIILAWSYGAIHLGRRSPGSRSSQAAVVSALVIPLFLVNSNNIYNRGDGNPDDMRSQIPPTVAFLQTDEGAAIGDLRYDRSDRFAEQWATMTQVWELPSANGNDPFLLQIYQSYRDAFELSANPSRTYVGSDYNSPLADLLGLRYVVAERNDAARQALLDVQHWKPIAAGTNEDVFHNQRVVPRAFVVPSARVLALEDTLGTLKSSQFDWSREVLLAGPVTTGHEVSVASGQPRAATYRARGPNQVDVFLEEGTPGWLVVTDVYYPGWVARIKGNVQPIVRADYLFRAVFVDGTAQTVTFRFEPESVQRGLLITLLAWGCALVLLVMSLGPWRFPQW